MPVGYQCPAIDSHERGLQLTAPVERAPWTSFDESLPISGGVTARHVLVEPKYAFGGFRADGFGQLDYYNRIHVTPLVLNLGNVVSLQTREVIAWNAYMEAHNLTAIAESNSGGISLTKPGGVPRVFNPLQEVTYTFSIDTNGPAVVDAQYSFEFDVVVFDVDLTGRRVVPWIWPPNWDDSVVERIEWKTDIMEAYDGSEQRVQLRATPRRTWEFGIMTSGHLRRVLDSVLYGWGARAFALPVWVDGSGLTQAIAAGSSVMHCATDDRDYAVGGLAIVLSEAGDYEVGEIQSIASGQITMTRPFASSWPQGTMAYPVRKARLPDRHGIARFTGDVVYAPGLRFESEDEASAWPAATATLYRAFPVMVERPNWVDDITAEYQRKLSVLDFGMGKRSVVDESGVPVPIQSHRWLLDTRARLSAFRSWLYARAGRAKAVWVPTWSYDLVVVAQIGSSATSVDVEFCGYSTMIKAGRQRRDIRIVLKSGSEYYRRITGATAISATVERLTIDSALGVTVEASDVDMISYMQLFRLDSDGVEIAYFTGDSAESAVTLRGIANDL